MILGKTLLSYENAHPQWLVLPGIASVPREAGKTALSWKELVFSKLPSSPRLQPSPSMGKGPCSMQDCMDHQRTNVLQMKCACYQWARGSMTLSKGQGWTSRTRTARLLREEDLPCCYSCLCQC